MRFGPTIQDTIITLDNEEIRDVYRVALMINAAGHPPTLSVTRFDTSLPPEFGEYSYATIDYVASPELAIDVDGIVSLVEEHAVKSAALTTREALHRFLIQMDPADARASSLADVIRDASRYRALRRTQTASPWANILGPAGTLDEFADAIVSVGKSADVVSGAGTQASNELAIEAAGILMDGARIANARGTV